MVVQNYSNFKNAKKHIDSDNDSFETVKLTLADDDQENEAEIPVCQEYVWDKTCENKTLKPKSYDICLESSVLVFGSFFCILSGLAFAYIFVLITKALLKNPSLFKHNSVQTFVDIFTLLFCLMAYTFSMVLLAGIKWRKSQNVLAYWIFGIIKFTIAVAVLIGSNLITRVSSSQNTLGVFLIVIYLLFLDMVWETYKVFRKEETASPSDA